MQVLLSQTTEKREEEQMIEQEQANPSTVLPSGVMLYEAQKIVDFLQTGIGILPGTGRSDWPNLTDEQFDYMLNMHSRLHQFYTLYSRSNTELPKED